MHLYDYRPVLRISAIQCLMFYIIFFISQVLDLKTCPIAVIGLLLTEVVVMFQSLSLS